VDVSGLSIGQSIRAGEVVLPGSVKLVSPADAVISHVVTMRAEEVVAPVAGAEAAGPAAAAEPEVIKKGKKDEDEEAADEKKKK